MTTFRDEVAHAIAETFGKDHLASFEDMADAAIAVFVKRLREEQITFTPAPVLPNATLAMTFLADELEAEAKP